MNEFIDPDCIYVIYDGECPFCRNYVRLSNLRATGAKVSLLDAREGGPVVDLCASKDFDLDQGMVVIMQGRFYHGGDAVNRIALMSSPYGVFNRFNRWIFGRPKLSRLFYPTLRGCRNATLRLLGISPINVKSYHSDAENPDKQA